MKRFSGLHTRSRRFMRMKNRHPRSYGVMPVSPVFTVTGAHRGSCQQNKIERTVDDGSSPTDVHTGRVCGGLARKAGQSAGHVPPYGNRGLPAEPTRRENRRRRLRPRDLGIPARLKRTPWPRQRPRGNDGFALHPSSLLMRPRHHGAWESFPSHEGGHVL